jgi:predicted alpha/beta-fold hydrolase
MLPSYDSLTWLAPILISFVLYLFFRGANSPFTVHVSDSTGRIARVVSSLSVLKEGFRTSFLLSLAGGQVTTVLVNACRLRRPQPYSSIIQTVHLEHGGAVRLRWIDTAVSPPPCTLLIFPGTRGTECSGYVEGLAVAARSRGWRIVVAPLRGCSEGSLLTPHCLDGQHWTDVAAVVKAVKSSLPAGQPLCAVGYSMGGGMLAHYVAAAGESSGLDCAVAVSAAADYSVITEHMRRLRFGWLFENALLYKLQNCLREHAHLYDRVEGVSLSRALRSSSLAEWHEAVTCP